MFFSITTANAGDYDGDILDIYSKLLPRFILMSDQNIKTKDELHICLLHEDIDQASARLLKDKINRAYPQGVKNYKIKFVFTDYTELSTCKGSELLFLFNTSKIHIHDSVMYAKKQKAITASYDASLLEEGVEFSLFLGRKTMPYINISALRRNGITLDPILLRISKLYTEGDR